FRGDKDQELPLGAGAEFVLEDATRVGNGPQQRNLLLAVQLLVLEDAAEHQGLAIAHQGTGLDIGDIQGGNTAEHLVRHVVLGDEQVEDDAVVRGDLGDRKSTRLNSSHVKISYAVFCLKKKRK